MMNNAFQSRGPAGSLGDNVGIKAFGEDLPATQWGVADKASGEEAKLISPARTGQVRNRSHVPAVDAAR